MREKSAAFQTIFNLITFYENIRCINFQQAFFKHKLTKTNRVIAKSIFRKDHLGIYLS